MRNSSPNAFAGISRILFDAIEPHQGEPELVAVGDFLVVDEDLCAFPIVDNVEQVEEVIDFGGRVNGRMADPLAVSLFFIGGILFGEGHGFVIVVRHFVAEDDRDPKGFGLAAGEKDVLEFLLRRPISLHVLTLPIFRIFFNISQLFGGGKSLKQDFASFSGDEDPSLVPFRC
jgi:hypothetical protein